MVLFNTDSQHREKAAQWALLSMLPLYSSLAAGRLWRWFAVNIPMDLGTGGRFTSDIDVLAKLRFPGESWIYRAWEMKVALVARDGTARSLKQGKTKSILRQLHAYREFGCPDVALLDTYLCEPGFSAAHRPPVEDVESAIRGRLAVLAEPRFGYQMLSFEIDNEDAANTRLAIPGPDSFPIGLPLHVSAKRTPRKADFDKLVERLDEFFEQHPEKHSFKQITFCRECRALVLVSMRDERACPGCASDLVVQS